MFHPLAHASRWSAPLLLAVALAFAAQSAHATANGTWVQIGGSGPPARSGHSAVYDPVRTRMLVFGGKASNGQLLNDLWSLSLSPDCSTPTWTQITTTGAPAGREGHQAIYDAVNDRLLVFFGNLGSVDSDTTWALPLAGSGTPQWTPIAPSTRPCGREGSSAVVDAVHHKVLTFAGADPTLERQDTWAFSLDSSTWTKVYPPDGTSCFYRCPLTATSTCSGCTCPARDAGNVRLASLRLYHGAVYDSVRSQMLVIAGWYESTSEVFSDLWSLSDTTWTKLNDPIPPGQIFHETTVVDPSRNRILLFGGAQDASGLNTAWQMDSSYAWDSLNCAGNHPAPRVAHSAIFDRRGDRMIVFGGRGSETENAAPLGDTWILNFDSTPPAAVNTLDFLHVSPSSATLRWNAPGDDGNAGRACSYNIRWATNPITDADFLSDTLVTNPPAPSPAGTQDTVRVSPLPNGKYLYFALKTTDESGNVSTLSNVPCVKLGPPYSYCDGGFAALQLVPEVAKADFRLDDVRPNPTQGQLSISFALTDASPARLEVVDLTGRRILSRDVGDLGAGEHWIVLGSSAGLRPGYYVVRLVQGDRSLHRSALVVR